MKSSSFIAVAVIALCYFFIVEPCSATLWQKTIISAPQTKTCGDFVADTYQNVTSCTSKECYSLFYFGSFIDQCATQIPDLSGRGSPGMVLLIQTATFNYDNHCAGYIMEVFRFSIGRCIEVPNMLQTFFGYGYNFVKLTSCNNVELYDEPNCQERKVLLKYEDKKCNSNNGIEMRFVCGFH